jgi:Gram-negative bacterial TonB protein C-terminal
MRTNVLLAAAIMISSSSAFADTTNLGPTIGGETIVIHDHAPPKVQPKPVKRYFKIAPHYSDYAIEHDTWAKAYLLLDINARGSVERVKLLKHPGADLDKIAVDTALSLKFEPAQDDKGNAIGSQVIWPIEWPSYWWMVALEGLATRIPVTAMAYVPCRGSGPLHLGSVHPVYRDCTTFKLGAIQAEPWIEATGAKK